MSELSSRRIAFTGLKQVSLEAFRLGLPQPDKVLIATRLSLMSTGTENIVFNRAFAPDSHWDRWVKYPFYPGYSSVGTVVAVGAEVINLKAGDRVAFRVAHQSHAVVAADECHRIPPGLSWEAAAWFALAKIAFHGARAAHYQLGDSVLIVGAGPIGQMSTRWARAAGAASISVVDVLADRMAFAAAGGATTTIVAPIDRAGDAVHAAHGGGAPRVVIDGTGNAAVFAAALGLVADRGTVVVLGDTGTPADQRLTADVILRGLTIVGAHDGQNTVEWNNATIIQLFFTLAASGRFALENLVTHRFTPDQCADAYARANRERASTMGILFDWTDS